MLGIIVIDLVVGAVAVGLWYLWFRRSNHRRGLRIQRWIEAAFTGHGHIVSAQWTAASRFHLRLRLSSNLFQRACVMVQLLPRELPLHWLCARLRKKQETVTFEADLDCAPAFNLEVNNHRWCGRTHKKVAVNPGGAMMIDHCGPFVLTTRNDWQREITTMMTALVASRDCDFLAVSFRRTTPHFSATVPLESLSPEAQTEADLFDVLRELAAGASTSRF
jgi:hypothetical protein